MAGEACSVGGDGAKLGHQAQERAQLFDVFRFLEFTQSTREPGYDDVRLSAPFVGRRIQPHGCPQVSESALWDEECCKFAGVLV